MAVLPRMPTLADLQRPSVVALLAANVVPLVGVLLLGWDLGAVMLLFWAENVVVGVWHAAKLWLVARGAQKGIVGFFLFHYGLFTFVHGVFVVAIFVQTPTFTDMGGGTTEVQAEGPWLPTFLEILPAVAALFLSHGYSFVANFVRTGEAERWRAKGVNQLMFAAYGRIVVLHVAILATGWLMMALGSPVWGLALLVALKTLVDLDAHLAQRFTKP